MHISPAPVEPAAGLVHRTGRVEGAEDLGGFPRVELPHPSLNGTQHPMQGCRPSAATVSASSRAYSSRLWALPRPRKPHSSFPSGAWRIKGCKALVR